MLLFIKQFILCFFVLSCSVVFSQTSSDDLSDRVKKEASDAWRTYFHLWNNMEVKYEEKITEGTTPIENNSCSMFLSYPHMVHQKTDNINHKNRLVAFNNQYKFSLEKKQEDQNWVIDNVELIHDLLPFDKLDFPVLFEKNIVSIDLFIGNTFARGFMFSLGDWFPVIFNQPEFHLLEVKEIIENGETLIGIKYDYNPPQRSNQLLRSGEVFLIPHHSWLIKRANVKLLEPNGTTVNAVIHCEYDFLSDIVPHLKSHTMFIKEYNYTFQRTFTDYQKIENRNPKEFTLSYYGFPEPDFDNSRRTNRVRYVFMGTGILLILIALWQMYRKQREK